MNYFKKEAKSLSGKSLGAHGEAVAEHYLRKHGYTIIKRNFRCAFGEIDIIAKEDDCIAFVEVKTRKNADTMFPEDSINIAKQKRLEKLADFYITHYAMHEKEFRFDVVSIVIDSDKPEIYLIKDAF